MNRDTYREHRIRGSLERHVGRAPMDATHLRDAVRAARREKVGIVFLWADLECMPEMARRFIVGEFDRLNGGAG